MGPRAKLVAIAALFTLPMVASVVAYRFLEPRATANFGELLLPPSAVPTQRFARAQGGAFVFSELAGRWVLAVSDSGACARGCRAFVVG